MQDWTIIIPVKGASATPKSRFGPGDHRDLALAMALDTVEVALAVAPVVVVTTGGAEFQSLGASVVQESASGLVAAVEQGLESVDAAHRHTAVLLGDHPALRAAELRAALIAAQGHPRAMLADSDGTGTAMVTALAGVGHEVGFGPASRAAHRASGYVELAGEWPGLARDIDVPDHLAGLQLGHRTRELISRPQF